MTSIRDTLIVNQDIAMLHTSQKEMCRSSDTLPEVCTCDGNELVNPWPNLPGLRDDHPQPLSQIIRTVVNLRIGM